MKKKVALGQISDYEIKHLRVFKTVVDCGGFSAAETALNISRPTISNHMASLEARLNLQLCKRGRAGFSLTEEGAVIYEEATKLLEMIEEFRSVVNNIGAEPSGALKVALSDYICLDPRSRFPEIIAQFGEWAPNVNLSISIESMSDIERGVLNGDFDIGFIPYHRKLEGLTYVHLFLDQVNLYCGRRHPFYDMPSNELTDVLINAAPMVHGGVSPHDKAYNVLSQMNPVSDAYFWESRIAMILSGRYIGFLPDSIIESYVASGELKPIATDRKSYPLGSAVVRKKGVSTNRAKEYFWKAIESAFSELTEDSPY